MPRITEIEIATTEGRLSRDFPGHLDMAGGSVSALYTVNIDAITSALGRFLAESVTSTVRGDGGSEVRLLLPCSLGGEAMLEVIKTMGRRVGWGLQRQIDTALEDMEAVSDRAIAEGEAQWDFPDIALYQWPVFGARSMRYSVHTPEEYFEHCAAAIRESGAVVLDAGPWRTRPPRALIEYQGGGDGLDRLARYDAMAPMDVQVAA